MPGNDADFAAYLAARWPALVRSLVLIGCPRQQAEDMAEVGLARCHASWERVRREDDPDATVYRAVLSSWHRSHRRAAEVDVPPEPVPEGAVTDVVLLRRALEAQLARLAPEEREILVLRFVAELDDAQVADVLEVPIGTVRDRLARGLAGIDVAALREVAGW
jgi:RNA polymerase sigma factor (sigma-70 family)